MSECQKVRDIMTCRCCEISEHESVLDAARAMKQLDTGALPICDRNGQLKGIVTDRDIVTEIVCERLDPARTEVGRFSGEVFVSNIYDPVDKAIEIMSVRRIRRLPVIDGGGKSVGMVSLGDIATHVSSKRTGEMLASISSG